MPDRAARKARKRARKRRKVALASLRTLFASRYPCRACGGSGARFGASHDAPFLGPCRTCHGDGLTTAGREALGVEMGRAGALDLPFQLADRHEGSARIGVTSDT